MKRFPFFLQSRDIGIILAALDTGLGRANPTTDEERNFWKEVKTLRERIQSEYDNYLEEMKLCEELSKGGHHGSS